MLISGKTTLVPGRLRVVGGLFSRWCQPAGFAALICWSLCLAVPASALETRVAKGEDDSITIRSGETIDDTLVAVGDTVNVDGVITGNLIVLTRRVTIKGTVAGDLISLSQYVDLDGAVKGNVFSCVQSLRLRGQVARSLYGIGEEIRIDAGARVDVDVIAFGQEVSTDGAVGRDLTAFAGSTHVRGAVGRNLTARTGHLRVLAPAQVGGHLTAYVKKKENLHVDSEVEIAGRQATHLPEAKVPSRFYTRSSFYFWQALRLAAAFLTGLLLFWLFPTLFAARLETAGVVLRTMGVGFLALVATTVAAFVAAITLVGLPVALLGGVAWLAGLYLAKIFVAASLGQALMRSAGRRSFAVTLLVGLVISLAAINIPYAGWVIHFLFILLGLGIFVLQVRGYWLESRAG